MANRVVHFEIEAKDKNRAQKFYTDAFKWQMNQMGGEDYGGYVVVVTGDTKEPGGINGGLYQAMDNRKEVNAFRCVIAVDDVHKSMEDIKNAGGKVLHGPDDIPNVGLYAKCEDTEGNVFGILQPSMDMKPKE